MLVSVSQQTYLGGRRYNDKSECTSITQWKQFNKQTTTDTKIKHSTLNFPQLPNEPARTVTHKYLKYKLFNEDASFILTNIIPGLYLLCRRRQ